MRKLLFFILISLCRINVQAQAQSGFTVKTEVLNVVDNQLQVLSASYEDVTFKFDLNKKVLNVESSTFGMFEEQVLNYKTGIFITPVVLDGKDYSFELANCVHEVWTQGAYWQLYASVGAPASVYVIVEHPYVGEVNKRVYFKMKQ